VVGGGLGLDPDRNLFQSLTLLFSLVTFEDTIDNLNTFIILIKKISMITI
jgi:hypothetical protein